MTARPWHRHNSPSLLLLLLFITIPVAETSIRLCGVRLTRTLMSICRNQLCGGFMQNKQDMYIFPLITFSSPLPVPLIDYSVSPTISYETKGSFSWQEPDLEPLHHTIKRSGIATECCEKRCSFSYLKTYCCNT